MNREVFEIVHPTNNGVAYGAYLEGLTHEHLVGKTARVVVGAQPTLFHHDLDFFFELCLVDF